MRYQMFFNPVSEHSQLFSSYQHAAGLGGLALARSLAQRYLPFSATAEEVVDNDECPSLWNTTFSESFGMTMH